MKIHQSLVLILSACFFTINTLQAQAPKPMVAYRIGIEWHFYNTKNELMFPVNKMIGPQMATAYFHGWCKVGLPDVIKGEITLRDGIINEKGIEVPLKGMPDGYNMIGVDMEEGKKILTIGNWVNFGCVNEQGKRVPAKALWHWQRLGNGWGAGYGAVSDNPEEQSDAEFPAAGESEMEYEIWDINNAKLAFKLNAEELGAYAEGFLTAKNKGLWGIVDAKGKWVVEPVYSSLGGMEVLPDGEMDEFSTVRRFINGAIAAKNAEGAYGLIDTKGNWLLKAAYTDAAYAGEGNWYFLQEDAWVLCDAKGKLWKDLLIDNPRMVRNNMVFNYKEEHWQLVNSSGKVACTLNDMPVFLGNGYFYTITETGVNAIYGPGGENLSSLDKKINISMVGSFSYGLVPLLVDTEEGSQLGFLNTKGQWAIAPGKIPFSDGDLPQVMDGYIYHWTGEKHIFYNLTGKKIREDGMDGKWEMMVPLQDGNAGFWAPN